MLNLEGGRVEQLCLTGAALLLVTIVFAPSTIHLRHSFLSYQCWFLLKVEMDVAADECCTTYLDGETHSPVEVADRTVGPSEAKQI